MGIRDNELPEGILPYGRKVRNTLDLYVLPVWLTRHVVRLALSDILLRGPRLRQSFHLCNPSPDCHRADTPHHRLADPIHGHYLGVHRLHQPFYSLPATTGYMDRRRNMRGAGHPGYLKLLCLGIIPGYRHSMCCAAWFHALQDPDEAGDEDIHHPRAWARCYVCASHCVL